MTIELEEISGFLSCQEPFSKLDPQHISHVVSTATMRYAPRGTVVVAPKESNDYCFVIRSGAVDISSEGDSDSVAVLLDRREAGRCFGYSTILGDSASRYRIEVVEDALLLAIHRDAFFDVCRANPQFRDFFSHQSRRMRRAAQELAHRATSKMLATPCADFMTRELAVVSASDSLYDVARAMDTSAVSAAIVVRGTTAVGIVTDRDFRSKVVGKALSVEHPVSEVMSQEPVIVYPDTPASHALLLMIEHGFHHLPVVEESTHAPVGMVESRSVMRLLKNDPLFVGWDVVRAKTADKLTHVRSSSVLTAAQLAQRGAPAQEVSALLSVTADSIAQRLCQLAEQRLGPPPVPYAFVVVGSHGRKELGFVSDQDNALVISDDFRADSHSDYFAQLGNVLCEELNQTGQVYCPGEMMASNLRWRLTYSQWRETLRSWITAPEPDALLYAQTFFDMRSVFGDHGMVRSVHDDSIAAAQDSRRLHAHLAAVASRREPPLGFFRGFVLQRSGDYAHTLDIKKGGIYAIVQLARLYSLVVGSTALSTRARLDEAAQGGAVSERGARDLVDAFEFLTMISQRHNSEAVLAGNEPSYHLDPADLSTMDREHLKDAFHIIKSMQQALGAQYPMQSM